MDKKDLMTHYQVNNDDELYEVLVEEKIKELDSSYKKEKVKESNNSFSGQFKKMQKSFIVSIIDVIFLIGFIFSFTFLYLLTNETVSVVGGLIVALILILLKQNHFASLVLLPVPVFLFMGGNDTFTDIGFILLSIATLGFLYYKQYNNSFYHYILAVYLIVFFTFFDDIQMNSVIAFLLLSVFALISWVKLRKYFVAFVYLIGVYIFSLDVIVSTPSLIVYGTLTFVLISLFVYTKNTTNVIEKLFSESILVLINISVMIYALFIADGFYYSESSNKVAIFIILCFFIVQAYILYRVRIQDLVGYLMLNVLVVFIIPYTAIYGLLEYDSNHFIVTVISLVLFFVSMSLLEKHNTINKMFKFILSYVFIFIIFFKLMVIDLNDINGFLRLTLLFLISTVLIITAIIGYIKNKKKNESN